jgi:chromosome segregation ATPase
VENSLRQEDLQFDGNATVSVNGSPILGKLSGPCADIINPTRNGRKYSDSLWETVFNSPIVKEYFACGGLFGELGHPADRTETDMEKIAICMPEPPVKGKDGLLEGHWDILNTPNGRILKCLCEYGYKIGISSRGSGDLYIDENGDEAVLEESYDLQAFDAVLLPAVKAARLTYTGNVNESLQNDNLKKALNEAYNKSNEDERKIMAETLNELHIGGMIDNLSESTENKVNSSKNTADNDGVSLLKDLREALKSKADLEKQVEALQEKLSVCYTKEMTHEDAISKYKSALKEMSQVKKSTNDLSEQYNSLKEVQKKKDNVIKRQGTKISSLVEKLTNSDENYKVLSEAVEQQNKEILELKEKLNTLRNSNKELSEQLDQKSGRYLEQIETLKKDSSIKRTEYNGKIAKANKLIEQYKNLAKKAVDKYIEQKALMIGIKPEQLKARLSENYSFDDIDSLCEEYSSYRVTTSKLPVNLTNKNMNTVKNKGTVKITESKETIKPADWRDDTVDSQLLELAGM